jgi:hypothetical protein
LAAWTSARNAFLFAFNCATSGRFAGTSLAAIIPTGDNATSRAKLMTIRFIIPTSNAIDNTAMESINVILAG